MTSDMIWTAKEAAEATGGRVTGDWTASGVSIDTRTLKPGDLFIALTGDTFDGHQFVRKALDAGAAAVVVSQMPRDVSEDAPLLIVADTFEALQDLGQAARHRCGAKIIGVTGSVGKTGTKDMMARAFGALGQTHASKASHNNHWGVPFSLSNMHPGCDYGIFEMGMNHAGEIRPLSKMVGPHLALITTVGEVHLEHFDSAQGIADAKAEIFDGMLPGGMVILNRDNEWFDYLETAARKKGLKVFSFGAHDDADARLIEILEARNGSRIKAQIMGEEVAFTLLQSGRHIALNALAVLLAVRLLDGDLEQARLALETMEPGKGRGARELLDIGDPDNPVVLIDESYNASPVAMKAAFKVLALIDPGRGGRRIAVLGDMLELGPQGSQMHADLALPLQAANVQLVYTCGPLMKRLHDTLPQELRGAHRHDSRELAQIVPDVLTPGDVVMVKGSNGSKMGVVVEALRALPGRLKNE